MDFCLDHRPDCSDVECRLLADVGAGRVPAGRQSEVPSSPNREPSKNVYRRVANGRGGGLAPADVAAEEKIGFTSSCRGRREKLASSRRSQPVAESHPRYKSSLTESRSSDRKLKPPPDLFHHQNSAIALPASIAGDTWPDVFATTLRSERTSGLRVPRHKNLDSMRTYCSTSCRSTMFRCPHRSFSAPVNQRLPGNHKPTHPTQQVLGSALKCCTLLQINRTFTKLLHAFHTKSGSFT
jgi:hypothetical protein